MDASGATLGNGQWMKRIKVWGNVAQKERDKSWRWTIQKEQKKKKGGALGNVDQKLKSQRTKAVGNDICNLGSGGAALLRANVGHTEKRGSKKGLSERG